MIKIVNKEEYENLIRSNEWVQKQYRIFKEENKKNVEKFIETNKQLETVYKQLEKITLDNESLKKEKTTLKSKITRLENQVKKVEEETEKKRKIVKETLKEVHKAHAKRATKKDKKGE